MTDVQERVGMPLDEFIRLSNDNPFEIINGERYPKLPTVGGHNYVMRLIFRLLSEQIGESFFEATYVLPDHYDSNWVTGSRTPDLMFINTERWTEYVKADSDWRDKPFTLVPDLLIEVVSPTDMVSKLDEKIDAYLADGVRLILVVDPQRRKAVVYSPDAEQPLHLAGDAQIDLSDVIPGLQIALPSLFD